MTTAGRVLTPDDLVAAPERALLATLDVALHVTVLAMVAQNADLLLEIPSEREAADTPRLRAANAMIHKIHALRHAMDRYRGLLDAAERDRLRALNDTPF